MKRTFLAIAGVLIALTMHASATVLDDFDKPIGGQGGSFGNVPAGSLAETMQSGLGLGALGDTRTMRLTIVSVQGNPPNPSAPFTGGIDSAYINGTIPDYFLLDSSTYADNSVWIKYDNNGAGLSLDLSGYSTFRFKGAANNTDNTEWWASLTDGSVTVELRTLRDAGFAGDIEFHMDWFLPVDLANIYSLTIGVNPMNFGGDASLDAIVAIVPEPNAAIVIAGLCGLGAVIRRVRGVFSA